VEKKLKAVALKYEPEKIDAAPYVVSKGEGEFAERIINIAKKHGVLVREDRELVEFLSKLEINEQVPPELYELVSELLAFVYKLDEGRIIKSE